MSQGDGDQITRAIAFGFACCSMTLTMLMIYVFARFDFLRQNLAFRLIFYLSCADLLWESVPIISFFQPANYATESELICQIEAGFSTFSRMAIICWTTAIAFTVYQNQVRSVQMSALTTSEWKYYIVCLLIPSVATAVPFLTQTSGYDQLTRICWVQSIVPDDQGVLVLSRLGVGVQIGVYYAPLMLALLFNFIVYHKAISVAKVMLQANAILVANKFIGKLRRFPIALLIAFLPGVVYRVYSICTLGQIVFLNYVVAICGSSIGTLNVLIYGTELFNALRQDTLCCCCCQGGSDRASQPGSYSSYEEPRARDFHESIHASFLGSDQKMRLPAIKVET